MTGIVAAGVSRSGRVVKSSSSSCSFDCCCCSCWPYDPPCRERSKFCTASFGSLVVALLPRETGNLMSAKKKTSTKRNKTS